MKAPIYPVLAVRFENMRNGTIGAVDTFHSMSTKTTSPQVPTMMVVRTLVDVHGSVVPPVVMP